ncbi:hypothetical protein BLA23254_01522 [Burkholderia lata]|uniref:Uncharacterized protein n=1 Tax=Burkholderia lata (strain ATCC 17760 / DSM 23089 / LMG 22485 / NCIMB 9086 / R18194 / 383) TaxID=482957 RepID=A0A6P2IV22_BURL3|nr:hypothetical protein BLA23254_01522 [Burkholderia lata]
MPGTAQCGSSPRRRFRDTEPIINQRDADRQPPALRTVGGCCRSGGASTCPASRFGNRGRTVAILPVQARAGWLTDCKESSDERRVAEFAASIGRNRCVRGRLPVECTEIGLARQAGGAMLASRSAGLRVTRGGASRTATSICGGRWIRRVYSFVRLLGCKGDHAQRHRLCMTTRDAFGQDAEVRIDHPADCLEVVHPDVQAQRALCGVSRALHEVVDRVRFGQANEAALEHCDEQRRSAAGDRSSQPRSVYHRTYGATRGTESHSLVRHATRKR